VAAQDQPLVQEESSLIGEEGLPFPGLVVIVTREPGNYLLSRKIGFLRLTKELQAEQTTAAALKGQIVAPDSRPIYDSQIEVSFLDANRTPVSTRTDREGRFTLNLGLVGETVDLGSIKMDFHPLLDRKEKVRQFLHDLRLQVPMPTVGEGKEARAYVVEGPSPYVSVGRSEAVMRALLEDWKTDFITKNDEDLKDEYQPPNHATTQRLRHRLHGIERALQSELVAQVGIQEFARTIDDLATLIAVTVTFENLKPYLEATRDSLVSLSKKMDKKMSTHLRQEQKLNEEKIPKLQDQINQLEQERQNLSDQYTRAVNDIQQWTPDDLQAALNIYNKNRALGMSDPVAKKDAEDYIWGEKADKVQQITEQYQKEKQALDQQIQDYQKQLQQANRDLNSVKGMRTRYVTTKKGLRDAKSKWGKFLQANPKVKDWVEKKQKEIQKKIIDAFNNATQHEGENLLRALFDGIADDLDRIVGEMRQFNYDDVDLAVDPAPDPAQFANRQAEVNYWRGEIQRQGSELENLLKGRLQQAQDLLSKAVKGLTLAEEAIGAVTQLPQSGNEYVDREIQKGAGKVKEFVPVLGVPEKIKETLGKIRETIQTLQLFLDLYRSAAGDLNSRVLINSVHNGMVAPWPGLDGERRFKWHPSLPSRSRLVPPSPHRQAPANGIRLVPLSSTPGLNAFLSGPLRAAAVSADRGVIADALGDWARWQRQAIREERILRLQTEMFQALLQSLPPDNDEIQVALNALAVAVARAGSLREALGEAGLWLVVAAEEPEAQSLVQGLIDDLIAANAEKDQAWNHLQGLLTTTSATLLDLSFSDRTFGWTGLVDLEWPAQVVEGSQFTVRAEVLNVGFRPEMEVQLDLVVPPSFSVVSATGTHAALLPPGQSLQATWTLQVAPEVNKLAETLLILSSSFNTRVDSARALIGILDPPPQVAAVTPPDGAVLNTAQPRLTVSLANEQVDQVASLAIDGLTVPLTVEGRDYVADLAQAQISLEEGHHSAVFQVIGRDDQLDVKAWSFTVETQDPAGAPTFAALTPAPGSVVNTSAPTLSAQVDSGDGSLPTVTMELNGQPVNARFDPQTGQIAYAIDPDSLEELLYEGTQMVKVTATNGSGRTRVASWTWDVEVP